MSELTKAEQSVIDDLSNFNPLRHSVENVTLANTNTKVDLISRCVQELNKGEKRIFFSNDSLADVQDSHGYLKATLSEEQLNKRNNSSAPPHELRLRVGDICILTRNISIKDGLVNSGRVRILKLLKQSSAILIETLDSKKVQFILPRIKFKFSYSYGMNFSILRQQFPLRLCYGLTVHKVQGQTYYLISQSDDSTVKLI